ncbi:transposase [uncultured Pseudoteredinibacter sp.]|uniref:transposase n=1 Tax=uncultured Pseudoteredinibacter sp. TaxID=1641701 RepID=UPI002621CE04|nr:transposase [uncultured Pseudoteredinibacter sp.]
MTVARSQQISLSDTPYYHCISRCVRRAFLCGKDRYSGRDYEHRRGWLEERILSLQSIFCIDVCAYAIMSNHFHIVLHVDYDKAEKLSQREVVERWMGLFKGSTLMQRFQNSESLSKAELDAVGLVVEQWRSRLRDISWFMRSCNEWLAREANREDECSGRFWEGRFKSQALLDEKALAACMAYVDLNPVRAKMAKLPEDSAFTSIKQRAEKARRARVMSHNPDHIKQQPINLFPFSGNPRKCRPKGLPFRLRDYLDLLDWTSRKIKKNKRGFVADDKPKILQRLGVEPANFLVAATQFEFRFKFIAGALATLRQKSANFGLRRLAVSGVF